MKSNKSDESSINSRDDTILSVSQFTNQLKSVLMKNFNDNIIVQGEISNLKISNNHSYLTLKDENSSVSCIMWNNKIDFSNGDNVIVIGRINIYNKSGNYNIVITRMKKVGLGDIYQAYEKRKEIYLQKGYFHEDNKKTIKNNIKTIGIVTALGGAAIKDILYVLEKNNFLGKIIIKNCKVQGTNCSKSITDGIKFFTKQKNKVDLILITRGGGSFEDLMGFSEEDVIKAIYECPILTISAVGHEVDTMLSDYVADIRAPTPSIAGEIICRYQKYNLQMLYELKTELSEHKNKIIDKINNYDIVVKQIHNQLKSTKINNIIDEKIIHMKNILNQVDNIVETTLKSYENRIDELKVDINRFDNNKMLSNGYCLVINENYDIIKTKEDFKKEYKKGNLKIMFSDGDVVIK